MHVYIYIYVGILREYSVHMSPQNIEETFKLFNYLNMPQ